MSVPELPKRTMCLDQTHTIFDSFFQIRSLKALASPTFQVEPAYLGLHEENDPDRRPGGDSQL